MFNSVTLSGDALKIARTFIAEISGHIVVWDIDGTLCRFKYTEKENQRLLPCKNSSLNDYLSIHNMYNYAMPIKTMQYIVEQYSSYMQYTLSTAVNHAKLQKDVWLAENYPNIRADHIIYSDSDSDKVHLLKELNEQYSGVGVVFVDDSYKTLLLIEEEAPEIILKHTSEFIL